MRLLRLSLENWRGVDELDVEFADGITLIEGPNEIGKSTIIEAVRMLFNEMDSSNKKHVKAIQPVGEDVGSKIEAEVTAGDYRFVYSKTYNKSKQTTLDILAPSKKQLTGREAHEAVVQMLTETVDMVLWEALLVDQGEKVALADIEHSSGLANALDAVAGSTTSESEDTDLYGSVQAEYEKYFTLKTSKPKFSEVEDAYEKAKKALDDAKIALAEVEADSDAHDRSTVEVRRLRTEMPSLKEKMQEHEQDWTAVSSLKEKVEAKKKELVSAQAVQQAKISAHESRRDLVKDIQVSQHAFNEETQKQEPLRTQAEKLKGEAASAQLVTSDLRKKTKLARAALDLAQGDERHIQDLDALADVKDRFGQLENISKDMKSFLKITSSITINEAALETFRAAEGSAVVARSKRDTAVTTVSVTAEKKLNIEFDSEKVSLEKAATEIRSVVSELKLRLPGVAAIQISPSRSVAELQEEVDEAELAVTKLASRFGVTNLEEAVAANQRRADAQRDIDRLKIREEGILQKASKEEIQQAVSSLQAECDKYLGQRKSAQEMPEDTANAASRVADARSALSAKESALEAAQKKAEMRQGEYEQIDSQVRVAEQELAGLTAALKDKRDRLNRSRMKDSDKDLNDRARESNAEVDKLKGKFNALQTSLAESSPDALEALLTNAKDVYERANADLAKAEQDLAVLTDRLQQAQADGRFETLEAAEREFEESQATFQATRRRADAVDLLWATLNRFRDSARQAYVRPLKEAIERLGRIVFGPGFEVIIAGDWSVESRTLDGKTLPFEDLSVGAKEQLGILARLAAAQIVSKQGGVPLIIDDALGFSDPSRLETMGAAIAAAGKQCQIIILTSTPGRFTHVGSADVVKL